MKIHLPYLLALLISSTAGAAAPQDLVRLYEEEILAHDLYVELGKIHPKLRPFQNIPHSEARHREAMAIILDLEKVGLPDPPRGRRFASPGLDDLFDRWLAEGRTSEVAACRVGVRLEEHDIADLRAAQISFPKHRNVLKRLEEASERHLRAFHRNLTQARGHYQPKALPVADFEAIIEREAEGRACGGRGRGPERRAKESGRGPRRGQGRGR
jgi:hypothetical protein